MSRRRRVAVQGRRLVALAEPSERPKTGETVDSAGLAVLAACEMDGRRIRVALVPNQLRLRVTFVDEQPPLLGHLTHLDTDEPDCHIAESAHLDWARAGDRLRRIVDAGVIA